MLWIKAFHIISLISWFAGLFYLPRLFVYHAMNQDPNTAETFKVMERKLYRAIMMPAMIATLGLGTWLWLGYGFTGGWLWVKLGLVVLLVIYHFACRYHLRQFAQNQNTKSHKYFRYFNELPTLLLIAIVILVVVKPF